MIFLHLTLPGCLLVVQKPSAMVRSFSSSTAILLLSISRYLLSASMQLQKVSFNCFLCNHISKNFSTRIEAFFPKTSKPAARLPPNHQIKQASAKLGKMFEELNLGVEKFSFFLELHLAF